MTSVGNAAGSYYMIYNVHADAGQVANFMALGSIPAFIFMPMVPAIKRKVGKRGMFYIFLSVAIVGMALLYVISVIPALRSQMWLVYVAQFVKSTGVIVGGVVPGLVLGLVGFDQNNTVSQSPLAEQGILWLVAVIPALLLILAMFIISKYELSDEVIDKINMEIEQRTKN